MEHLTIIIGEDGNVFCIDCDAGRAIMESLGLNTVRRASHVEPNHRLLRFLFHLIRRNTRDESALAEWTRHWRCVWRVRLAPEFGGHVLRERFIDRIQAIEHEVEVVNAYLSH